MGGVAMRGFGWSHPAHEDVHVSAADDEELLRQAVDHRDQCHPETSDEQIREIVTANARDE